MIDSTLITLDYHDFSSESYEKFSRLPGFVLLQSTDKSMGRYDILSAYPYERMVIKNNIHDKNLVLTELKNKLKIEQSELDLPFQGGAIGYVSYDFGTLLHNHEQYPQKDLAHIPVLNFGFYDWAIIVDHHLKKVTLFARNSHSSTKSVVDEIKNILNNQPAKSVQFSVQAEFLPLISKENYRSSFNAIQQALRAGRSYQVNFTQPFQSKFTGDPWYMYQRVNRNNFVPYAAFIRTEEADILSFSPERFLLYDNGEMLTSPIKGTIHRSKDPVVDKKLKEQLLKCPKNKAENVMIVDLLRNDLGKLAKAGSVKVMNLCHIQSFNAVHHLVSDIRALCKEDIHPIEAFFSCFPGGSITGAPKLETMKIISEQEIYKRGVYCGCIAYFSQHGRFDANIAIRTVTAKDNVLYLAAGGGIVIDSDWEDEYRECFTKITAIINGIK
ncbi:TPA: aminodeoxychorismate synthase component I [Legionella pneumophila]|uniref:aminodeoxychorismate synthase n=2 Tax=Legionella pneumophila TaxID=446 RepID=A0A3A6V8L0_LEGPN|nr:aminodeoxychorismate synthase component I [Legionella pneumophila]ERH42507.1 aminodeoxychorismate synthase [Legionella pneumophila str. Leg01/11]ERI46476.1 aminodeoxychorismate synthase [Legionella pneumophila str. Leg01/20]ANH12917.1 aminodeoxychorismate synthase component I [Legionella pneumophila]ANH15884.1 aminodeoxychorismate synthase component I [Legionella pneumophila]ANH18850.1 aminodeoxychorismate synthase component I [Legionella pneumophila]